MKNINDNNKLQDIDCTQRIDLKNIKEEPSAQRMFVLRTYLFANLSMIFSLIKKELSGPIKPNVLSSGLNSAIWMVLANHLHSSMWSMN